MENLQPPDLSVNPFFLKIMQQVDWIARNEGKVYGFINWQGVLNNAQRIRGQELFMDFYMNPEGVKNLLDCVCTTMIEAAKILQQKQRDSGIDFTFFTVSNCLVNMLSPELYAEFIMPLDRKIAASFETIGIHNCAWSATPYLDHYAKVPKVGYIDMGMDSDLEKAKNLFPETRRAIMYTPMDVANKSSEEIKKDMEYIAAKYGPCDIVAADIEYGTPDEKVMALIQICAEISDKPVNREIY
jgi:uroporphyrinogen-III decarboxylase